MPVESQAHRRALLGSVFAISALTISLQTPASALASGSIHAAAVSQPQATKPKPPAYQKGYRKGYAAGKKAGHESCEEEGGMESYDSGGKTDWYTKGWKDGYDAGWESVCGSDDDGY